MAIDSLATLSQNPTGLVFLVAIPFWSESATQPLHGYFFPSDTNRGTLGRELNLLSSHLWPDVLSLTGSPTRGCSG